MYESGRRFFEVDDSYDCPYTQREWSREWMIEEAMCMNVSVKWIWNIIISLHARYFPIGKSVKSDRERWGPHHDHDDSESMDDTK